LLLDGCPGWGGTVVRFFVYTPSIYRVNWSLD
jgi:hypothetical protein